MKCFYDTKYILKPKVLRRLTFSRKRKESRMGEHQMRPRRTPLEVLKFIN